MDRPGDRDGWASLELRAASAPLRNKPTIDGDGDLSLKAIVGALQPGMGERNVGERIDGADMWLQLASRYQCAQLIELAAVLSCENEVITRISAPGLNEALWLCSVHDGDHAAQLCKRVG